MTKKETYTGKEVLVIFIILLFMVTTLIMCISFITQIDVDERAEKMCTQEINEYYIPKNTCTNVGDDIFICNARIVG